jgi:hypothetical protein
VPHVISVSTIRKSAGDTPVSVEKNDQNQKGKYVRMVKGTAGFDLVFGC